MASPSPEKDNFLRIAALLIDGGAKLLRGILDSIHNTPASLSSALTVPKTKRELKGACRNDELNKLYPTAGGQVKSEDLDITLLSKVLRHACRLPTPHAGWNTLPSAADQSPSDDLVRIRIHRNEAVAHAAEMKLEAAEFERIWNEISAAMIRLAKRISTDEETEWKALVQEYGTGPVTCEEEKYRKELMFWCERDRLLEEEMRAGFQDVGEGIAGLSREISNVRELVSSRQEQRNEPLLGERMDTLRTSDEIQIGDIKYMESGNSLLGKGSGGTEIYKGKQISCSREVAVKKMFKGIFDVGEAKKLRRLDHPNIIKCFTWGEDKHFLYLGLELCQQTLALCLEENDFQRREGGLDRLECLKQVTRALVYLHDHNICHRDIKPDNVLLACSNSRRFVLADFNIAKHESSVASMTVNLAGTPGYIAREIYEGVTRFPAKADVFSLGCVFYFTLTEMGHPFGSYRVLKKCADNIRRAMPPQLVESDIREHVWIMKIIEQMVKHDPLQRPDAKEVLRSLEIMGSSDGATALTPPASPSREKDTFLGRLRYFFREVFNPIHGHAGDVISSGCPRDVLGVHGNNKGIVSDGNQKVMGPGQTNTVRDVSYDVVYDVFISYSSKDAAWVGWLVKELEARGFRCCVDYRDFLPGVSIVQNIADAIYSSRKTIAVLSPDFLQSNWCHHELQQALARVHMHEVVPVVYRACHVPLLLRDRTYVDWDKPYFWESLERELRA